MRISKTFVSVVVMILMAIASFLYLGHLGLRTETLERNNTATMTVADTNGLVPGARVLLRGIQIGYVKKVEPSAEGVAVTWTYDRRYRIPTTSDFRVDTLSALGEPYVAIRSNDSQGPFLANHAAIDRTQVQEPTSFQELSKRLTLLLEQVEPDRVRDIFTTLNVALPDGNDVLGNLNQAGKLLAAEINRQGTSFNKLLTVMQPLLLRSGSVPKGLAGAAPNIPSSAQGLANVFNAYYGAVGYAPLPKGMVVAEPFLDEAQKFLDKNATDLHTLGVDLLPGVRAGAAAMRTIPITQLLQSALAAAGTGGPVTLHLRGAGG